MKNINAKIYYPTIDIAKFIAALFVVAIHTMPLDSVNATASFVLNHEIARLAVPFFFVSSGFLLADKDITDKEVVFNYLKRLIILYSIWSILYLPIIIIDWQSNQLTIFQDIGLYLRDYFAGGSYGHFWYFTSLIYTVFTIYLLNKKYTLKIILIISFILYIICTLGNTYYGLLKYMPLVKKYYRIQYKLFNTFRIGLFFGMMFVTIGLYIKKYNISYSLRKSMVAFILSLCALIIEVFMLKRLSIMGNLEMPFSMIPATYFLFIILKNGCLENKRIYTFLRHSSILIYTSHMLLVWLAKRFHFNSLHSCVYFLLIAAASILFSVCVLFLENKKHFWWLKYLH